MRNSDKSSTIINAFLSTEQRLRAFFRRRFGNHPDIDDLTQEVFLRACKSAEKAEIQEPKAYLFGIARYVMLTEMGKRSSSIVDYIEDIAPEKDLSIGPSQEEALESAASWRRFAEAVASLPPQCQRVFVLKKVYGYSNREVSAALNISTSTVEKHVAMGLRRTSDYMQRLAEPASSQQERIVAHPSRRDGS